MLFSFRAQRSLPWLRSETGATGPQLQRFAVQVPLQQSAFPPQNQPDSWQQAPFEPHISPFAASQSHGPPQPSSGAHTLPTSPPLTQPEVGVHWHTPRPSHTELPPEHEPQLPPQPSGPQFLPAHWGAHTHA